MITRRQLLQASLALSCAPLPSLAASDDALKQATGPDWAPWMGPTPPLALPDMGGRTRNLNQFRGNVVIVSFWATWCEPCRAEIPAMSAMAKRHREEGLRLIAVNVGESAQKISAFVAKLPVAGVVLQDRNSTTSKQWDVAGMPGNFLVDRSGTLRFWHLGALDWHAPGINSTVTKLLRA